MNKAGQKTQKNVLSGSFCVQIDTYVSFFLMEVEKTGFIFKNLFIY